MRKVVEKCNQHSTSLLAFNSEQGRHSEYCKACDKVHFTRWFGTLEHRKASAKQWSDRVWNYFESNSLFVRLIKGVK